MNGKYHRAELHQMPWDKAYVVLEDERGFVRLVPCAVAAFKYVSIYQAHKVAVAAIIKMMEI